MSTATRTLHDELGHLQQRLKTVEEKRLTADRIRAEADAEEADVHARLAQLGAGAVVAAPGAVSALPPLPRRSRGQGDRVVALLRERPRADPHWLAEKVYGEDSGPNRQTLSSLLNYLENGAKKIRRVGDRYEAMPEPSEGPMEQ